jgi:hypothetical protein
MATEAFLVIGLHVLGWALPRRPGRHQTLLDFQHFVSDLVKFLVELLDQNLIRCREFYGLWRFWGFYHLFWFLSDFALTIFYQLFCVLINLWLEIIILNLLVPLRLWRHEEPIFVRAP